MTDSEILPRSGAITACAARIAAAPDVAALASCAAEARQLATALHREEAGAALVTGVLSRLNDAIAARVLALLQQRFRLPPARWCWLGLGSEGRLEQTLATLEAERSTAKAQFDELHAIFLAEHANQVEGRKQLKTKQAKLEAKLTPPEVTRFHRLAAARKGRVVVAVENGACSGCNVKLRGPFLFQLKEAKGLTTCESCQRILFLP